MIQFAGVGRKDINGAQTGPVLSWSQRVKVAVGAAKGLEYFHKGHSNPIIHCNITSRNVLLFDDDVAKISYSTLQAYDTAREFVTIRILATFDYNAPEYAFLESFDISGHLLETKSY